MNEIERNTRIRRSNQSETCAQCGAVAARPLGTGAIADGRFCSLECYARFSADTLRLRLGDHHGDGR